MNEKTTNIKGYGFIEVNGKRYDFENDVSMSFDTAINHFLSRQGLTRESIPTASNLLANVVNGFSLVGNEPEIGKLKLYDELGFLPMNSFEVQGVDFKMTRLRGAAISSNNGTVRGGGFNIITKNRRAPLTTVPFLRRKITIPVSTFYSIPVASNWFYHYGNKAFYHFQTNGAVNKILWDYETGLWGEYEITTTEFSFVSNSEDIFTDGVNRLFAIANSTTMRIYDFITDSFTNVTLQFSLATTSNIRRFLAWDEVSEGLKCVLSNMLTTESEGFIINVNGTINLNTGTLPMLSNFWYPVLFEEDIIWSPYSTNGFNGSLIPSNDVNFNPVGEINNIYGGEPNTAPSNILVPKLRYCPRNNNRFIYADFTSTTPTSVEINFCQKAENYTTILGTNPIPVEIGDSLVIEYTFNSGI